MAEPKPLPMSEVERLLKPKDPVTQPYYYQQTMLRIKDPRKSLPFFTGVLGMTLLHKLDFPQGKFTLYFMGYENEALIPRDHSDRIRWTMGCRGTLELTHNWGTENDPNFFYHDGNTEPRGFGHYGIQVPDVEEALKRFEKLGVVISKRPNEGMMKGLVFIRDPDGYWIEVASPTTLLPKC